MSGSRAEALIVAGLLEMLGSLLTAFAPSLWLLILGRAMAQPYDMKLIRNSYEIDLNIIQKHIQDS